MTELKGFNLAKVENALTGLESCSFKGLRRASYL